MLADRFAESDALLRVVGRVVECAGRDAERLRGDAGARFVEHVHRDLEAFALFAQAVRRGNFAVVEHQLDGRRTADAHLFLFFADAEARACLFDDEGAHAARARCGIGYGEDADHVGNAAVGDPNLLPVEQVRYRRCARRACASNPARRNRSRLR